MREFNENVDFILNSVYDEENAPNGGGVMTAKDILKAALKDTETTQAEAAKRYGWSPQKLNGVLVRDSIRADDFINLLDVIGVEVKFVVKDSGKPIRSHLSGYGRRVRAMVDKVIYDTGTATAISNNFYADGVNEYNDGKALELYIDRDGRYFFAEYSSWEGVKDRISPISAVEAAQFIEKYGTEIMKTPKKSE